jgi:hypothetical protein
MIFIRCNPTPKNWCAKLGVPETHIALQMDKDNFVDISTGKPAGRLFALNGVSFGGVWDMYLGDHDQFPNCARSLAGIIVEDHGRQEYGDGHSTRSEAWSASAPHRRGPSAVRTPVQQPIGVGADTPVTPEQRSLFERLAAG